METSRECAGTLCFMTVLLPLFASRRIRDALQVTTRYAAAVRCVSFQKAVERKFEQASYGMMRQ